VTGREDGEGGEGKEGEAKIGEEAV